MIKRTLFFVALVFVLLGTFFLPCAQAIPYILTPLTSTPHPDFDPQVNDQGYTVWAGYDGTDFEIFFHDGDTIHQLTDNTTSDMYPQINTAGYIVWEGHDGSDTEIFLYNGAGIIPLTDNLTHDRSPRLNNLSQVVWEGNDSSDSEIYFFDGNETIQLSNNSLDDSDPQISENGFVVWMTENDYDPIEEEYEREIILYDGSTSIQLTDNLLDDKRPQINNNGFVVWCGYDGSDWEIFFHDGESMIQITDNNYTDYEPQINDENIIVWDGLADTDSEIFIATPCLDSDDDGYCAAEPDCDDNDPDIHPDAIEICNDGKDNDCDSFTVDDCPLVTVDISASSSIVSVGEGIELTWSSTNATAVVIDQGIGSVALNGSYYFAPTETALYTITATGPDGVSTASIEITVTGILQAFENKFIASDAAKYDHFGLVVDIGDDFAIVGAVYDDNTFVDAGAAYIYQKGDSGWFEKEKLVPGDSRAGDSFGGSVAMQGDYAIAGAMYADYTLESSGAAYIFHFNGTEWVEQTKIQSSGTNIKYLGQSVAITKNYAVIGGEGKVLIYRRDGDNWLEMVTLADPIASGYSAFGIKVSADEDTLIIGSYDTAYIYRFNGLVWNEEVRLTGSPPIEYVSDVSIYGDYAAVSNMYLNNLSFSSLGAVYLYHYNGTAWSQQAVLTPEAPSSGIGFGSSVDVSSDYLAVGAKGFGYESYWNNNGWSYVFKRNGAVWEELGKILAADGEANDYFGTSAAISGANIIIGANGSRDAGSYTGSAYIYELSNVIVEINADPETTPNGESVLRWSSANADSCTIEPEIGNVPLNGNLTVFAETTTTYTLACMNSVETASSETTVTVGSPPPVIIVVASPEVIQLGETSILTWQTLHADTVVIDHGIGVMPANGSAVISPAEANDDYKITAVGPGGEATATTSVMVLPTISVTASLNSIQIGDTVTITWDTLFADSCSIEPDVGIVPANGSIEVTPSQISSINTYTITATGPAGDTTASVDISVSFPPPTIDNFSASEVSYYERFLSWRTTNADTCSITPQPGEVPVDGSQSVYVFQNTIYTLKASGPGGVTTTHKPFFVGNNPAPLIVITSPQHGDIVNRSDVLVEGRVYHSQGLETGVIVNGVLALIDGDRFVANHVPLVGDQNTITAVATDTLGNIAVSSISVNAITTGDHIKLVVSKESGLAPLDFTLRVDGTFSISDPDLSYAGPGTATVVAGTELNEFDITLTDPGLYYFNVTAADSQAKVYWDTVGVQVLDKAALDALLRAMWNGMKTALLAQNIEGGLGNFSSGSQQNYRDIFNLLITELPQLISNMQDIEMIYAMDGRAKYRINRLHDINGSLVTITHFVYFLIDETGQWKIEQF